VQRKLRVEALKKRTWRQHLAAARNAFSRFVNFIMGIPPGAEAMSGMFFMPVRFLSAAVVSTIGVFVWILVAESSVRWVFTQVYLRRALVINDTWAAARASAASMLGNIIASPAYPLSSQKMSMYNQYDVWAVVYTVLRHFGQDISKVDDFANSVRSATNASRSVISTTRVSSRSPADTANALVSSNEMAFRSMATTVAPFSSSL
jgi:hypothetical protein